MWLRRLTLVNWANLPNDTYEFDQVTLITGATGAGKTTLLDAIQALMTAATKGLYLFNPGQEEANQNSRTKTPRTLASYALGCDEGAYARPNGSNTYVIGYFEPNEVESGRPFTALMGLQATLVQDGNARQAREDDRVLMVVHELELGLDDVVRKGRDHDHVVDLPTLLSHLRLNHPGQNFQPAVNKQEYIAQLYGAFMGHRGTLRVEQAKRAARQFTQFMAYRKIENLDEFVRLHVLEPEDLKEQIRQVSGLMRDVQKMRQDAEHIQRGIDQLKVAERTSRNIVDDLAGQVLRKYESCARDFRALQQRQATLEAEQEVATAQREALAAEMQQLLITERQDRERAELLRREIAGFTSYRESEALSGDLDEQREALHRAGLALLHLNEIRHRNSEHLDSIQQSLNRPDAWQPGGELNWGRLIREAVEGDSWRDLHVDGMIRREDFTALLDQVAVGKQIDRRYNAVVEALGEHREAISRALYEVETTLHAEQKARDELDRAIEELEQAGRVIYPRATQVAKALIEAELPGANPRVLCDYVEVTDEAWQLAIEGMFGDTRFDLVVEPAFEARAIALLNGLRRGRRERVAAVIQGERARREAARRDDAAIDSVVKLMAFTDPTVEAFVRAAFARRRQVASNEALTREASGLTIDGNSSGGFRMRVVRLDEADLVFGRRARERALKGKRQQRELIAQRIATLSRDQQMRRRWLDAADKCRTLSLGETVEELVLAHLTLKETEQKLADLDVSDIQSVKERIATLDQAANGAREAYERKQKRVAQIEAEEGLRQRSLDELKDKLSSVRAARGAARERVERFRRIDPGLDWDQALGAIEQQLDSPNWHTDEVSEQRLRNNYRSFGAVVADFNATAFQGLTIEGLGLMDEETDEEAHFQTMVLLRQAVQAQLERLRDNILARNHERLAEASQRFNSTFVTDVCLKMNRLISDGRRTLSQLNEQLRNYYFGNEYYRFDWTWRSDLKPYADFFERMAAVRPDPSHGDLFERPDFTDQDREIFDSLQALLLQGDARIAERELERLTDYRQYRSYDIYKHFLDEDREPISLKRYGTGSGGQTENPFYVIRAASLASALRWNVGDTHLRFVMIDESFTRLDVARSKESLSFLTNVLGLQVIFVVKESNSGPLHDAIDFKYDISKVAVPERIGELKTRVKVQPSRLKRPAVTKLFDRERMMARNRASHRLAFLEGLNGEAGD